MNEREGVRGGGRNALAASLFSSGVFADSLLSPSFSPPLRQNKCKAKRKKQNKVGKSRQSKALKWNMGCGYVYQTITNHSIKKYIHTLTATTATTTMRHNGLPCYCYDCKKRDAKKHEWGSKAKGNNKQLTTQQIFA